MMYGSDLRQDLGQFRPWHPLLHFFAQSDEAGGFIELVKPSQDQIIFTIYLFDSRGAVTREIR